MFFFSRGSFFIECRQHWCQPKHIFQLFVKSHCAKNSLKNRLYTACAKSFATFSLPIFRIENDTFQAFLNSACEDHKHPAENSLSSWTNQGRHIFGRGSIINVKFIPQLYQKKIDISGENGEQKFTWTAPLNDGSKLKVLSVIIAHKRVSCSLVHFLADQGLVQVTEMDI